MNRKHPFTFKYAACLVALAVATGVAHANDEDSERERLARIENEIAHVQALVSEAGRNAPAGQRVQFRYDWLLADLQMLRDGIAQHLDAPRQPRPVPPLRGDYRQ